MKKISFVVSFKLPVDATPADARRYVRRAVEAWGGSLDPGDYDKATNTHRDGDPFFGGPKGITVRQVK